jgi:hypothetical protein
MADLMAGFATDTLRRRELLRGFGDELIAEVAARDLEAVFLRNPAKGYSVMQRVATLVAAWLRDTQTQLIAALTD